MSHEINNEEIEIKIKLTNDQSKEVLDWLQTHAVFKKEVLQEECYLDNPNDSWFLKHKTGYRYALKYLRVRFTKEGDFVCFKNWETSSKPGEAGLFCKDIEYQASSGKQAILMFQALGFTDVTTFKKSRFVYSYNDFEFCVDTVEGLGVFFEIEVKNRKYNEPNLEYQRLLDLIKNELKIMDYKIQKQGFIVLLWNPNFQFGETLDN